jgi:hypothetical protein
VERSVTVSTRHFEGDEKEAIFDFDTTHVTTGAHAYWLRVVQSDFHRAWTSPIYVTVTDEGAMV